MPLPAVVVGLLALLMACSGPNRVPSTDRDATTDARPKVLTTFTILADMASNVAGGRLQVESITKPGAEIHGYEFTPSDIERASGADLIVENGLGLELWARRFTAAAGQVPTVTLTTGLQPLLIEEYAYAGRPNPHAWMSPNLPSTMSINSCWLSLHWTLRALRLIGATVSSTRPVCEPLMRSCARAWRPCLKANGCWSVVKVLSYLARDYGLQEAYLWPVNAESQITPRRMARLIDRVKQNQVPAVFCETTVSDQPQREAARAAGSRFEAVSLLILCQMTTVSSHSARSASPQCETHSSWSWLPRRSNPMTIRPQSRSASTTTAPSRCTTRPCPFCWLHLRAGGHEWRRQIDAIQGLTGFVRPSRGRIRINGVKVAAAQRRAVAYVPQSEGIDCDFPVSVWDVVMMGRYGAMNCLRIPRQSDRIAVRAALERVDLLDLRDRPLAALSGGQRKRAFLARAIAQRASVLLDEPFNGVDVRTEKLMAELFLQFCRQGCSILISTHDLSHVRDFCDLVVLINKTVLAYGETKVFTREPVAGIWWCSA